MAKLSPAESARLVARKVAGLSDAVVRSFAVADAKQRTSHLRGLANEISIDAFPFLTWLERRRSHSTADLEKRRLFTVLDDAVSCVEMEIAEYKGGAISGASPDHNPSEGARRTATMLVTSTFIADSLVKWAEEIERETSELQNVHVTLESIKVMAQGAVQKSPERDASKMRSRVKLSQTNVVVLDEMPFAVKPNGYKLFELLLEAPGEYVSLASHSLRTRDVESLPEKLRDVVESDPGAGTRIKREYLP